MHASAFVERLQQRGYKVQQHGREWRGQCPAHGGEDCNLAISDGDFAVFVSCWSRHCDPMEIAAAVGVKPNELWFDERPQFNGNGAGGEQRIFPYRDERGETLYEVHRVEATADRDKDFTMWLPGAERAGGTKDVRRVLFGLPELLKTQPGEVVAIAEGEKCALAVASRGIACTTNPNGAGQWRQAYTDWLKENLADRLFLVLPDNDKPGKVHALAVCDSLKAAGLKVWLADLGTLPEGGDVVQWFAAGGTPEQLRAMAADPPPKMWARLLSWEQLLEEPEPQWLVEGLFFEETMIEVFGEPNSGKSFVVMDEAIALRRGGEWCGRKIHRSGPVLYVNADGGRGFPRRARAWTEIHGKVQAPHQFWTYPEAINLCRLADLTELMALISYLPEAPVLAVFDTYSRCIPGVNENLQEFASMVVDHLDRLRLEFHMSVKLVHHTDLSGTHARGSSVIIGACDTQARVEKSPDNVVSVKCEKQRDEAYFEPFYFDLGRVDGTNTVWITQRGDGPKQSPTEHKETKLKEIKRIAGRDPGITIEALQLVLGIGEGTCRRYVDTLIERGEVIEAEIPRHAGQRGTLPRGIFPRPPG